MAIAPTDLSYPDGDPGDAVVGPLVKSEHSEKGGNLVVEPPPGDAVQTTKEGEVLLRAEPFVERGRLREDTRPRSDADTVDGRIQPEHVDLARIAAQHSVEQPDRRRLAGTVVSEQTEGFARADLERQLVNSACLAETTGQIPRANGGCRRPHCQGGPLGLRLPASNT
jgi:hypothetical protein